MWETGFFEISGTLYDYCAKVYEEKSRYGIDGGRISKLSIYDNNNKKLIYNYDRGLDIDVTTEAERAALDYIKAKY